MPRVTEFRDELAKYINSLLSDCKNEAIGKLCKLSPETIRRLRLGKVPEEGTLIKFARGMNCDLDELLIAAGYKEPSNEEMLKNVIGALRGDHPTPAGDKQIRDFIDEMFEKYKK